MIFDLLTIKDLYNRIQVYPHSSGNLPFNTSSSNVDTIGYQIEEGYYFEFAWGGYEARVFTTIALANVLSTAEIYSVAHAIKITYRSNRGIVISDRGYPVHFKTVKSPASETFTTATILLNCSLYDVQFAIDIMDESYQLNPEEVSEGFPEKGDYLIIKNIEILQLPS